MVEMGYTESDVNRRALLETGGNVDKAVCVAEI
jgi:hypothetical protein